MGYKITVIGGTNTDICGSCGGTMLMEDSNPGKVTVSPGGVARNIAHDLCLMGAEVCFISAFGCDGFSRSTYADCKNLGMDVSLSYVSEREQGSTYLYVTDRHGALTVGINDMDIVSRISPEFLAERLDRINSSDAVVIDTNLSEEALEYICLNCAAPLYCDPVSYKKAARIKPWLSKLRGIKPNRGEAEALTGTADADYAAAALIKAGVKTAFVSICEGGVVAADGRDIIHMPAGEISLVNDAGAGDAAMAAMVLADVMKLNLQDAARLSMKAAALTCESESANSPRLKEMFS